MLIKKCFFFLEMFVTFCKNFLIFSLFFFSFHYRNRLENNSEHWNALLLSLRELTEWVIRKDTELSSLGMAPVRGDSASLQKQLVSEETYK